MEPEDNDERSRRKPLEVGTHNRFDLGPVAATTAVAAVAAVAVAAVLALIIPGLVGCPAITTPQSQMRTLRRSMRI
jgi:hypothetical protein